ncbi:MAG: DUF899 domain-containing protein, partial [Xanthomonadaceae bacterium]|nr:DUF899 domain-containing protein [Xanthomonadaceae bacterium]
MLSLLPNVRSARRTSTLARSKSPSCAIAMPRNASAGGSSRNAMRLSAPSGSPTANARAAAVINESMATSSPESRHDCHSHPRKTRLHSIHAPTSTPGTTNTRQLDGRLLAQCADRRLSSSRYVGRCPNAEAPGDGKSPTMQNEQKRERPMNSNTRMQHHEGLRGMSTPPVLSRQQWQAALQQMLVKEKALTRARDALAAERRRMPWMAVEKAYVFDGPDGKASLLDLFAGRRQLIVYRAFFEPGVHGWPEHACIGCSLGADQVSNLAHLNARDTTLVYASRAPQADIARLKARMGWEKIPWYTITDTFDADFGVDEWHGHNAFIRDGDRVFRTYFTNNRGDEAMGTVWSYLDITALGRQEEWEDSPEGYPQGR